MVQHKLHLSYPLPPPFFFIYRNLDFALFVIRCIVLLATNKFSYQDISPDNDGFDIY